MHVWMDTQCGDCTEWWRTVADLFPYNQVHNIRTGCNSPPPPPPNSQETHPHAHSCSYSNSATIFFLRAGLTRTEPGLLWAILFFCFRSSASVMVLRRRAACTANSAQLQARMSRTHRLCMGNTLYRCGVLNMHFTSERLLENLHLAGLGSAPTVTSPRCRGAREGWMYGNETHTASE